MKNSKKINILFTFHISFKQQMKAINITTTISINMISNLCIFCKYFLLSPDAHLSHNVSFSEIFQSKLKNIYIFFAFISQILKNF